MPIRKTDLIASNGVIHTIEKVLLPPSDEALPNIVDVISAEEYSTFLNFVTKAGLLDTLSDQGKVPS